MPVPAPVLVGMVMIMVVIMIVIMARAVGMRMRGVRHRGRAVGSGWRVRLPEYTRLTDDDAAPPRATGPLPAGGLRGRGSSPKLQT